VDKLARLPADDRRDIFGEAAARLGIRPTIVEKDFWVCIALKFLFRNRASHNPSSSRAGPRSRKPMA
jgi:hypothetical protein